MFLLVDGRVPVVSSTGRTLQPRSEERPREDEGGQDGKKAQPGFVEPHTTPQADSNGR